MSNVCVCVFTKFKIASQSDDVEFINDNRAIERERTSEHASIYLKCGVSDVCASTRNLDVAISTSERGVDVNAREQMSELLQRDTTKRH